MWRAFARRHAKRGLLARASCEPRACGDCGGLWRGSHCVGCARESSGENRVNKKLRWSRACPKSGQRRRTPQANRGRLDTHATRAGAGHTASRANKIRASAQTLTPPALARVTARHPRLRKTNPRWRGSLRVTRRTPNQPQPKTRTAPTRP